MAARCIELLNDPELYRRMSRRARQRALTHYDKQKVTDLFERCYLNLLK